MITIITIHKISTSYSNKQDERPFLLVDYDDVDVDDDDVHKRYYYYHDYYYYATPSHNDDDENNDNSVCTSCSSLSCFLETPSTQN